MILSERELGTVLAALRHWQMTVVDQYRASSDVATRGGELVALDDDEIDELCERINVEDERPAYLMALCERTGTHACEWEHFDGMPSTGVGAEYWLRNSEGMKAYIVVDQDDIRISLQRGEIIAGDADGGGDKSMEPPVAL
jgi:hypothetical protein